MQLLQVVDGQIGRNTDWLLVGLDCVASLISWLLLACHISSCTVKATPPLQERKESLLSRFFHCWSGSHNNSKESQRRPVSNQWQSVVNGNHGAMHPNSSEMLGQTEKN